MVFLWTNAARNRGQHVVLTNLRCSAEKIAVNNELHELADVHSNRTLIRARWLGAFQAAERLLTSQLGGIPQVNFRELSCALLGRLLRHALPRKLDPFFVAQWIG